MRLLKGQNTNLRNIYGKGVKYDVNGQVIMDSTNSVLVPKGTGDPTQTAGTALNQRPVTPINGHIRYNTDSDKFEGYEAGAWVGIANTGPAGTGNNVPIVQQNLGNGDATNTVFGPLNNQDTFYPDPVAAQNMLVLVENVFQLATTNYTLEQNPTSTEPGAEINDGSLIIGVEYYIISQGTSDFTTVGSADNNADTVFTATGTDAGGDGTVRQTGYYLQFTSAPDLAKPVTAIHNFDR